jgi:hypothetical protein
VRLTDEDPSIFAKCLRCDRRGRGVSVGSYYGKAFNIRQWRRQPLCENCKTVLVEVRRIELEG